MGEQFGKYTLPDVGVMVCFILGLLITFGALVLEIQTREPLYKYLLAIGAIFTISATFIASYVKRG